MTKKKQRVVCQYCGRNAVLIPANQLRNPPLHVEYLYYCSHCNAWVAAHSKTKEPMGILADGNLRRLRYEAHKAIDSVWQSGLMSKTDVYCWLSSSMGIPREKTHIGSFNEHNCREVIRLCSQLNKSEVAK